MNTIRLNHIGILLPLAIALFSGCSRQTLQSSDSELLTARLDSAIITPVGSIIRPYRDSISKEMDQVIGHSSISMEKGKPESALGNFVSDVCLNRINDSLSKANQPLLDFFVFNSGGLRGVIPQGSIKKGDVFQVMPFDNELVWVEITYDSLVSLLDYIGTKGGIPVSGISMVIKNQKCQDVRIYNGKTLNRNQSYRIGTNDFLARGGDGMTMLASQDGIKTIGVKVRDAIIDHIQWIHSRNGSIDSKLDRRIHEQ